MNEALAAETVLMKGHGGDDVEAYLAQPSGTGSFGSVVVIHHLPGYDSATKEITRKFAAHGYAAMMPNLYYRDSPGESPDDAAAAASSGLSPGESRSVVHVPQGAPASMKPLIGLSANLSCPLLGLFGADDQFPTPAETAELSSTLDGLAKPHEFHTFTGAGHAFFSVDRASYRVEAAVEGWDKIWAFYGQHLAGKL